MKCIYCLEDKEERLFEHTEHVIPRCFGVFENNLTLNQLVCDDCNQYFGDNLEIALGRDSLEAIARFNFGKSPKSKPVYRRLKFRIGDIRNYQGVQVIPIPPNNRNGFDEIKLEAQVGFFNKAKNEYDYFQKDEIPSKSELEGPTYDLKKKEIVFYGDIEGLVQNLAEKGLEVEISEIHETLQNIEPRKVPVLIKARIDRTIFRGISKIVFNYLAFNMERNFVLSSEFNDIRNFIRNDVGEGNDFFKINTKPILLKEKTIRRRMFPGHIIVIDWSAQDIIGNLSLFNSIVKLTYRVTLAKNYAVWFLIQKGHSFNPKTYKIKKLVDMRYLILPRE